MRESSKLSLPKKHRPKGLFLYCNSCKNYYSNDKDSVCRCDNLKYKARIHVPGTNHGIKIKVFDTKNFREVLNQFYEFKDLLQKNCYQSIPIKRTTNIPIRLLDCFAYYMGYLNNVGVPMHKQKNRDKKYIAKFDSLFEQYKKALELNGVNCEILKFREVNDDMVGFVHEHFLNTMALANKTYNNNIALLSAFTTHVINKFKFDYQNPFLGIPEMLVTPKVKAIGESEF